MSKTNVATSRRVRVRPMYGHGMTTVAVREHTTLDLIEPASEDERTRSFNLRCNAIQDYLAGRRADPNVLDSELAAGTLLGADDFDQQFEHGGLMRRCG